MAVHKGLKRPLSNDDELIKAVIYCKHHDGELCNMCVYGKYSPHCSDVLADAVVRRMRELLKSNK